MGSHQQGASRQTGTNKWKKHFEQINNRKPTREEGLIFGLGFNMGWKGHCKISTKHHYKELSKIINNLEDDMRLDIDNGENGYSSKVESYDAIQKYTLKILNKLIKSAKHNAKEKKDCIYNEKGYCEDCKEYHPNAILTEKDGTKTNIWNPKLADKVKDMPNINIENEKETINEV